MTKMLLPWCLALACVFPRALAQAPDAILKQQMHKLLHVNLEDDDPQNFGADADGKTCLGGTWGKFKLNAKCETLLGYLVVENTELATLNALKNIKTIKPWPGMVGPKGASIYIVNNHKLTDISALKLLAAPGDVVIEGNNNLANANLAAAKIGGNVYFNNNAILKGVVVNAEEVLGDVKVVGNAELQAIDLAIKQVKGALKVVNNKNLVKVNAGKAIKLGAGNADGSSLIISGNDQLANLDGLRAIQGILKGSIEIANNGNLKNVDGLKHVQNIGMNKFHVSLSVKGNKALNSLMGFNNINGKVAGSIQIDSNPSLRALAGFQAITEIGSDVKGNALSVQSNNIMAKFFGFENLVAANGALVVKNNPNLEVISGLRNLRAVSGANAKSDSLEIMYNAKLKKADLLNLVSLQGGVVIKSNPHLSNLIEFAEGMKKIGGDVVLQDVKCFGAKEVNLLKIASKEKYFANLKANANDCVGGATVGTGRGEICGGTSAGTWKTWSIAGSTGLYLDVDTTKCNFAKKMEGTPNYVTSISGDSAHWQLTGVNSVYKATPSGFRIHVWHPVMRGKFMQFFAMKYKWEINWLADTGKNSGITTSGSTGWKAVPNTKNVIYADVNTAASGFKTTPRYISAIHGGAAHWKVTGAHSIYHPTKYGFRVYVVYPTAITAEFAETNQWTIAYVGSTDSRTSGSNNPADWKTYTDADGKKALKVSVDSSHGRYKTMPTYVTSLSGESHHWMVTGAGAIYGSTNIKFSVYLSNANTAQFASDYAWRINYVAFAEKTDCVLTAWSSWQQCSKSCGSGIAIRTRDVITYAYYGGACPALKDSKKCNVQACPVDCTVTSWSTYSACSKTCGAGGTQSRSRTVVSLEQHGGKKCPILSQEQNCDMGPCPIHCSVTNFGAWNACSKSCGTGSRTSRRQITRHARHGGFSCPSLWKTEECNTQKCPVDCVQSGWSLWSTCSQTCATGTQSHTRSVVVAAKHGGKMCGANAQYQTCKTGACPVHCKVSTWSIYSKCTNTCSHGKKTRTRKVIAQAKYGGLICPSLTETAGCINDIASCPVDCVVSAWTIGVCSKSCGTGIKTDTRSVVVAANHGGRQCPGQLARTLNCNTSPCPIDCGFTWGAWSTCSKTCAQGEETRSMMVRTESAFGGKACPIVKKQQRPCDAGPCPVHCLVSGYSSWTLCSKTCGVGTKTRTRNVIRRSKYGGVKCPDLVDSEQCSKLPCPIDCVVSAWDQWTACSKSCATGEQWHSRTVLRNVAFGGVACPILRAKRSCNSQSCPVDCVHSDWAAYGACSVTCGQGGYRTRTRTIATYPKHGGKACGKIVEASYDDCDLGACPVHCTVSKWTPYPTCSLTCGTGYKSRSRSIIIKQANGGTACPALLQRVKCNTQSCPIDCQVSAFGRLSICDKTCGGGSQSKTRDVIVVPRFGGKACVSLIKTNLCNTQACPIDCVVTTWKKVTACSKTCGTGFFRSTRQITTMAQFGGVKCPATTKTGECATNACPVHCSTSRWGEWTGCSASCGGGVRTRTRSIIVARAHGGAICPSLSTSSGCNHAVCPVDCKMTPWSAWAPFRGGGSKLKRTRAIVSYEKFGGKKCGVLVETRQDFNVIFSITFGISRATFKKHETGIRSAMANALGIVSAAVKLEIPNFRRQVEANTLVVTVTARVQSKSVADRLSAVLASGVLMRAFRKIAGGIIIVQAIGTPETVVDSKCKAAVVFGQWSSCNKKCGTGYRYRHWERVHCSGSSTLKFHIHMRQGMHCNLQACVNAKDDVITPVFIPPITGAERAVAGVAQMAN